MVKRESSGLLYGTRTNEAMAFSNTEIHIGNNVHWSVREKQDQWIEEGKVCKEVEAVSVRKPLKNIDYKEEERNRILSRGLP